jgi:putative endopeptidase
MDKNLLKQDLYEAVNGDWLKTAVIPADKPATGGFQDLVDGIDKLLMNVTDGFVQDIRTIPDGHDALVQYVEYYKLTSNFEKRDADCEKPLLPYLAKIEALTSFADLNAQFPDWIFKSMPLPLDISVDSDLKHSKINALFASSPGLFLPDKTYYEENHPNGAQLAKVFADMSIQLLELVGRTPAAAEKIVEDAMAFDRLLAPHVKSAEENADYSKIYNPQDFKTFTAASDTLDLAKMITSVLGVEPDQVIVTEPEYFKALATFVTEENFQLMKNWMIVNLVNSLSGYLSEEFRQVGGIYGRTLSGTPEARPQQKSAYYMAYGRFSQVVGDYYGRKYFGAAAKNDVEHMVKKMIAVYKDRLANNTWLSQATRDKAIVKLNTLGINVGYPDKIPAIYAQYKTQTAENGGTLLGNTMAFSELATRDSFSKWNKEIDRDEWEMSASTVNAYYHPFRNLIVFPAAILQAPFYSFDQSKSQNYGGIGAVIAHEISHAFDNNGALFDEEGNLNNWWSEEDLAHFQKLADAMIAEFDGIEFAGGTVNGKLTVSENIADAGGLSCALAAAKTEHDVDLPAFFINWARIWRLKAREEYMQLLLSIDVHGPAKLRANIQPQNLADFYEAFDITAADAMYLAPEKRVNIW